MARLKMFDETTQSWVYADNVFSKDGKTPVKGVDYFTEADKAEFAEDVKAYMDAIPSYWQTALDSGVEAINKALCEAGRNKSAFLFYSDAHWNYGSQMSPTLLKYLYKNTGLTKTFFGGDIMNDEATDYNTMEYLWEWRKQLKDLPNHHSVVGNHDDGNATNNLFSEQYVYGYLLGAEETHDMVMGDGLYYYVDSPAEKTRYLCLDTAYKGIDSSQRAFIIDTLKSTPSNWHIVVVAHIWYMPDYDQYNVRPIPIIGLANSASSVSTILDSYNARNDEFANCGAKVEFCIGGHVHRDFVGTTDGGIPIVVVETDSKHIRSELSYHAGTTDEASVNGIIADYNSNTLNVVRVGRGNSFTVNLLSGESNKIPDGDSGEQTYTNVLDTVGYTTGRINSSGELKTDRTDREATGFINAKTGDTVYFKNISMLGSDYGRNVAFYGTGQTFITGKSYVIEDTSLSATFDADGMMTAFKISEANVEWVRFTFVDITEDSIITINEPIPDDSGNSGGGDSGEQTYTNVLDTVGWKEGYRLSGSDGTERENVESDGTPITDISGFIPFTSGQRLYLKNVDWKLNDSGYGGYVAIYKTDKTLYTGFKLTDTHLNASDYNMIVDENGYITKIRLNFDNLAYVRICALNIDEDSIITVDEPIE